MSNIFVFPFVLKNITLWRIILGIIYYFLHFKVVQQIKDSINTSTYKLYKFHHNSNSESEDNYKQDIYSYLNSDSEEIIHQLDLLNGW